MRHFLKLAVAAVALVGAQPASADTVCEWMEFAGRIANGAAPPPGTPRTPDHERVNAQVAIAMFEALNAIDRRYESYLGMARGDRAASQDAAAATAAYRVLLSHFPSQRAALEESHAIAMETVTDARAREAGRLLGEQAATLALAAGGIDRGVVQTPYRPRTTPGVYVAPGLPAMEPWSTAFRPWAIPSIAALMPPPPPALTSAVWARDYEEVRRLGGRTSTARTPHQTLMARYRITPDMMPSLRMAADAPGRSPVQNARMFALVEMAGDDSHMVTTAAKLHYNFWRPITAIRNGADDGNEATVPDPAWTPLIATPNHPEYPCGHCTFAASTAEVMRAEVGERPRGGVRVTSRSVPNAAVQVLPSWSDWVREVSFSRTLGGVHYRFANEAGEEVGRRAARIVLDRVMRPLPAASGRRRAR